MTKHYLDIDVVNRTNASMLYVHVTGRRLQNEEPYRDLGPMMMKADGQTPHMLTSGGAIHTLVTVDHGIRVGGPGARKRVRIPRLAGGRIYFSMGRPLKFYVNPSPDGPALVEPSSLNKGDVNYNGHWSFAELTFNAAQVYANVSYVDFLSIPIALHLTNDTGRDQEVRGIPWGGVTRIAEGLEKLGGAWKKLVVRSPSGSIIRILSMNSGYELYPDLFKNFFRQYIDEVWKHYERVDLLVDTKPGWGTFTGRVRGGQFQFTGKFSFDFEKPTTRDVFTCNTGPFGVRKPRDEREEARLAVGARISAALNRGTLLINNKQPRNEKVSTYYEHRPINHYSKIVHSVSDENRGYTFPYDDVCPDGQPDQSGFVNGGNPKVLKVTVGGFRRGKL
ncbi:hypothetical protein G7Z17_g12845 [Cylindrodendrum hubeiense]|uniref:GH64 domain-containing protein n=1 Tax=Cylindrodendrum hubeiense TaxID=595255 RepID=A0A9P5GUQ5_9HYPO|nr:hypothetical protein G7Z17_g12845 [Cylindrodendrum hubeiense]